VSTAYTNYLCAQCGNLFMATQLPAGAHPELPPYKCPRCKPLTEARVIELAREEIRKAHMMRTEVGTHADALNPRPSPSPAASHYGETPENSASVHRAIADVHASLGMAQAASPVSGGEAPPNAVSFHPPTDFTGMAQAILDCKKETVYYWFNENLKPLAAEFLRARTALAEAERARDAALVRIAEVEGAASAAVTRWVVAPHNIRDAMERLTTALGAEKGGKA